MNLPKNSWPPASPNTILWTSSGKSGNPSHPREKEVAALVCLGCTNRQAAARMSVTPATVKFHLHNVLEKFSLESRSQLQKMLEGWDFSAWE